MNIDNDVSASSELSEKWQDDLLEMVHSQTVRDCDVESERDDDDEPLTSCTFKTHEEALKWIRILKMHCLQKDINELMAPFETADGLLENRLLK